MIGRTVLPARCDWSWSVSRVLVVIFRLQRHLAVPLGQWLVGMCLCHILCDKIYVCGMNTFWAAFNFHVLLWITGDSKNSVESNLFQPTSNNSNMEKHKWHNCHHYTRLSDQNYSLIVFLSMKPQHSIASTNTLSGHDRITLCALPHGGCLPTRLHKSNAILSWTAAEPPVTHFTTKRHWLSTDNDSLSITQEGRGQRYNTEWRDNVLTHNNNTIESGENGWTMF